MGYRWRCVWHGNPMRGHEFDSDTGECPLCGRSGLPHVQQLVFVHFMMPAARGPFMGPDGIRRAIACEPEREALAHGPLIEQHYAATDDVRAVTCPSCKGVPLFGVMHKAILGIDWRAPLVSEPGCCG